MDDKEIYEALENLEIHEIGKLPKNWEGYKADDMIDTIMALDKPNEEKLDLAYKAIKNLGDKVEDAAKREEHLKNEIIFRSNWSEHIECAKKIRELLDEYNMRLCIKGSLTTRVSLYAVDEEHFIRDEHDFFMDAED